MCSKELKIRPSFANQHRTTCLCKTLGSGLLVGKGLQLPTFLILLSFFFTRTYEISYKHIYHQHLLSHHHDILHFSIVSCNQLYCVQEKSFSHSSLRCIFLYSVHAGGDPSPFLPLASCAMSRNYVKMGRPTNQPGAVYVKTTAI